MRPVFRYIDISILQLCKRGAQFKTAHTLDIRSKKEKGKMNLLITAIVGAVLGTIIGCVTRRRPIRNKLIVLLAAVLDTAMTIWAWSYLPFWARYVCLLFNAMMVLWALVGLSLLSASADADNEMPHITG
jgi:hypothetical protein